MRGTQKGLERLNKKDAVLEPPLCKGRWLGEAETEGLSKFRLALEETIPQSA